MVQLVQAGRRSSHRMCRRLHSLQPFLDLRCERRVLTTPFEPELPLSWWCIVMVIGAAGCALSMAKTGGEKNKRRVQGRWRREEEGRAGVSDPEARMLWVCLCLSGVVVVSAQPELK